VGAGLIEVGYADRGGVGISDHLQLLDYLLASGLAICGIGTTDSHGGRLLADPQPGSDEQWNFVTWIGGVARISPASDLIAAMRACNLSFGNPFYVRGGIWVSVGTDSNGGAVLLQDVAGVSTSAQFFLYEAAIDSTGVGHDPVYRQSGRPIGRNERAPLGGCGPGFARIEAWVGDRALAFSNVVRVPADPGLCAPTGATK